MQLWQAKIYQSIKQLNLTLLPEQLKCYNLIWYSDFYENDCWTYERWQLRNPIFMSIEVLSSLHVHHKLNYTYIYTAHKLLTHFFSFQSYLSHSNFDHSQICINRKEAHDVIKPVREFTENRESVLYGQNIFFISLHFQTMPYFYDQMNLGAEFHNKIYIYPSQIYAMPKS